MRHLPKPADKNGQPFVPGKVFELCVSMVRATTLRAQLKSIQCFVKKEETDYDTKAKAAKLYRKISHKHVKSVQGNEMVKVYTLRMVPKTSKGRPIYDKILSIPMNGKCPLCGIGTVNSIDHYLPKTLFPVYCVTPNNLVPVCSWCQREKGEYFSTVAEKQLLHPYFDNLDDEVWLSAKVEKSIPAVFKFFATPPNQWNNAKKQRVVAHLKEIRLSSLFSSNAGSRLSEIRARLRKLYEAGGSDAVHQHLREELVSIETDHKNSWVAAMYRAAMESDWFCEGGFLKT